MSYSAVGNFNSQWRDSIYDDLNLPVPSISLHY